MKNSSNIDFQKWENDCLNMEKFCHFVRLALGPKAEHQLGHLIGSSHSTVRKWLDGTTRPKGEQVLKMIFIFGPQFIIEVADQAPAWVIEAARVEQLKRLEAEQTRLAREIDRLAS